MANMKNTNIIFKMNHTRPGTQVNGGTGNGGSQPPMNRIVVMAHMVRIATYSPKKNSKKGVDEYSTAKPATSSDSASTKSKGARLVSASAEIKKMMNIGNSGNQNQLKTPNRPSCALTMSVRLSDPTHNSTVMMTKPMETSYDTICAAERNAARNGYFEFDAQPAIMMPYTLSEEIAKM